MLTLKKDSDRLTTLRTTKMARFRKGKRKNENKDKIDSNLKVQTLFFIMITTSTIDENRCIMYLYIW